MQPLSLKLNDADTSMPILVEGKYALVIDKAEVVASKSGKGSFLAVTYKTVEEAQGSKGQSINAGFPMIQRYMLPIPGTEFGDGEQAGSYQTQLCRFMLAVANLKDTPDNKASLPEFNMEYIASLQGVNVLGNIKTSKPKDDSDEYGERSEVKSILPIG
jgi:hypothetical protein